MNSTDATESPEVLRVQDVAHKLGQHRSTVYRKIHAGFLPAVRLGSGDAAIRIKRRDLEAWLRCSGATPPKPPASEAANPPTSPQRISK